MSQTDFILRSLSKIAAKRWEHYIINRIWHRLDDPEIEFVCQQCVRSSEGRLYLADFFLPQLGLYLEVDEGHHEHEEARIKDAARRFDIAEAAGLEEHRIAVTGKNLTQIDAEADAFTELLRARKAERVAQGAFRRWDYEGRYKADRHLEAGFLEVGPDTAFATHREALRCFGYKGGDHMQGAWRLPDHVRDAIGLAGRCMVWFPKLYEQPEWLNSLSEDGLTIAEINKDPNKIYEDPWDLRIVMARSKDELGRNLYRFIGLFAPLPEFRSGNEHKFRRIGTKIAAIS